MARQTRRSRQRFVARVFGVGDSTDLELERLATGYNDARPFDPSDLTGYVANKVVQRLGDNDEFWNSTNSRLADFMYGGVPPSRRRRLRRGFFKLPVGNSEARTSRIVARMIDREYYTAAIRDDLRLLPSRLVSNETAVYERWNRINAEAEFREGLLLPVAALAGVVAYRIGTVEPGDLSGVFFVSLVAAGLVWTLSYLSAEKFRESRVQLLEALDVGLAQSRFLDEISTGDLRVRIGKSRARTISFRGSSTRDEGSPVEPE
jgi:hypothetical protein